MNAKPEIRLWIAGLALFAIVIALGVWLKASSTFGILDHQIAGTAKQVDTIQEAWKADGVRWLAIAAMAGDLIFIGVYGLGSWIAGHSFMKMERKRLKWLGAFVIVAAAVFLFTDYTETVLQFIQLVRDRGSDQMAQIAASMQTTKIAAWIVTFIGVIVALALDRFSRPQA